MTDQTAFNDVPEILVDPPTEPGWYGYSGGAQTMTFLLRGPEFDPINNKPQWFVILDNGESKPCEWGYIEQALGVWDLVKLVPAYLKDK